MAPRSPRFQVELRAAGRVVVSTSCGAELRIGEGGGLVVPGLGGEVALVQDGKVIGCAGLVGETDGARGRWIVLAHPELEITIEPIESIAIERGRSTMIPTRETVVAAALACCLAGMLGRTAIAGTLVEPEREIVPEDTAIALAIYAAPIPEPVFVPPVIRFAEIEPVIVPEVEPAVPPVPPPPPPETIPPADVGDGLDAVALKTIEPAPKKRRRGKPRPTEIAQILDSAANDAAIARILGSSSDAGIDAVLGEVEILSDLPSVALNEIPREEIGGGGVPGAVLGGVPGGVPGGVAITETEPAPQAFAEPTSDPFPDGFTLADAFAGHPSLARDQPGTLTALLHTSKGTIRCELFEDRAPRTVANFVGLALGTRPSLDPETKTWRSRKLYTSTIFHRVVAGFVIQGGDPNGNGTGGPGYTIRDEVDPDLDHDAAGVLSMANRGPDTAGSQFFVTLAAAPHIDGTSTVFGRCDLDAVRRIGEVAVDARSRPLDPVTLRRVEIVREAQAATVTIEEAPAPLTPSVALDAPAPPEPIEEPGTVAEPDPTG